MRHHSCICGDLMSDYSQLDKYVEPDLEKMALIEDVRPMMKLESSYIEMNDYDFKGNYVKYDHCLEAPAIKSIKICPKCKKMINNDGIRNHEITNQTIETTIAYIIMDKNYIRNLKTI